MKNPWNLSPLSSGLILAGYLCIVKWGLPAGALRQILFFGGGSLLGLLVSWRQRGLLEPLFRNPWRGMWGALYGFALLTTGSLLILYTPFLQPFLPYALLDLAGLFDPLPVYVAYKQGELEMEPLAALPAGGRFAIAGGGAVCEEWIFRIVLFWRWLKPEEALIWPRGALRDWLPALAKLSAVSVLFALLHWPQPPEMLLVALLGSLMLGLLLLWRGNFTLVAALHVLFNWKALLM